MPTRLSGQIEHITFTNQETGFTIAKVKVPGRYEPVTVVGTLLAPTPGEVLEMVGEWTSHPRFGDQFKVEQFTTKVPGTIHGIVKYLGSGMIKGLGPVMAERIVARFGKRTLDIIESDVGRLAEVPGVGAKRIGMIATAWESQREIRDVMVFLQSHGVGTGFAAKIFRQYGSRSVAVVRENPYRLATDIAGVGFVMADRIAGNIGIPATAPMRVEAGILFVLQQISEEGHTYHPRGLLVDRCREILKVEPEAIELALMAIQAERRVVIEPEAAEALEAAAGDAVFLTTYHVCETTIARRLKALLEVPRGLRRLDADRAVAWVQAHLDLRLSETQAQALQAALDHKVMVITGGPGTGKTTVVNAVLKIFERASARVLLAAPTGRAAKRLNEATGREARTIHRLLEFSPQRGGFQRTDEEPLECDLLVVDEASMVDTVLMHHLIAAVPLAAACILVGDVNQLPSVGPGNVLGDIIDSGAVPVVRLTEIFRQASRSRIVVNAHRINQGLMPEAAPDTDDGPQDFYFIEQEDPERVLADHPGAGPQPHPAALRPRPGGRHPGPHPDAQGGGGGGQPQPPAAGGPQPRRGGRRARGPAVPGRRQGHAGAQQLRQGRLQRGHRPDRIRIQRGAGADRPHRRPRGELRLRGAGRARPRLRRFRSQGPGLGVPGGGLPRPDPALHPAAAQPHLHRAHPRPPAGRHRGDPPGARDRDQEHGDGATLHPSGRPAETHFPSLTSSSDPRPRWVKIYPILAKFLSLRSLAILTSHPK